MWRNNKYHLINGKEVGKVWKRQPKNVGYSTFPYGYSYTGSIGYMAESLEEAKRQIELNTKETK